jgi:tRNA uridine 5-carbamoylmethylation protein Kti12
MTTLTILRGLPGSGKTTRARELVADDPRCARVWRAAGLLCLQVAPGDF